MFFLRDISSISNGEINADKGDLKVSTATESLLNTINFCLLTAIGSYKPRLDFGASPEKYLGKPNIEITRNYIRMYINYGLRQQGILNETNYSIIVSPVSEHEIAVIMKIILEVNEPDQNTGPQETIIAYKYDFNNGTLEKVK